MNESCKYIIVVSDGSEMAIVFNAILFHSQVASGFNKVVSAGECYLPNALNPGVVTVWGKSISLKIDSRPEDAEIIRYSLGLNQ